MRLRILLLALPILVSTALAKQPQNFKKRGTPIDPMTRYTWLGELAGSCWRGTTGDGKPADTQCYSTQYGHFLRGTLRTQEPRGDKVVDLESDSILAWDPVIGNLEILRWSSDGSFRRGEATLFKGVYRFQDRTRDGSPPVKRTIWRRTGPDAFEVTLEHREGDHWVEAKVVSYQRVR